MRFQARKSNGRFMPNTLENTLGLSIVVCSNCGRFNPYPAYTHKPDTCHNCGASLTPLGADAIISEQSDEQTVDAAPFQSDRQTEEE